jgi:hypothetical protein
MRGGGRGGRGGGGGGVGVGVGGGGGSGGGGGGGGGGEAARSPLIYVLDMPPVLRFGVDFAPAVELKLTERLLRSSHRAATPEAADYFWMPGAPLVIEGHRLLARLWLVAERWLPDGHELLGAGGGAGLGWANSTGARWHGAGSTKPVGGTGGAADAKLRPLVFMPLLTERASMDSFQLSYSDNDREEWPGLETALHVRGLFAHSPACRYHHEMKIDGESHEAAATTDEATEIETLSMDLLERRLARALAARRRRVSASSLVALFGGGGYEYFEARAAGGRGCSDDSTMPGKVPSRACRLQLARNARRDASGVGRGATSSARDYCTLPESFLAWSPKRFWAGVQFNGNTRGPVWFQRGRDVVIPQLLLLKDGGSHADQPSCERMAHTSPFSPSFGSGRARGVWRPNLLWFGGHPGHDDARTRIFRLHRQGLALGQEKWKRGIVLFDSKRDAKSPRLDAINMSLTSRFCWVPRGQGQGDPTRHMVAIFHGCVPVFTLGPRTSDDALPLDELLPWPRFSLRVPTDELPTLPDVLNGADGERLRAMQAELACVWRSLFWTSLLGSCFGEPPRGDAFDGLLAVLRLRLRRFTSGPTAASACDVSPWLLPAV